MRVDHGNKGAQRGEVMGCEGAIRDDAICRIYEASIHEVNVYSLMDTVRHIALGNT